MYIYGCNVVLLQCDVDIAYVEKNNTVTRIVLVIQLERMQKTSRHKVVSTTHTKNSNIYIHWMKLTHYTIRSKKWRIMKEKAHKTLLRPKKTKLCH